MPRCIDPEPMIEEEAKADERQKIDEEEENELELELEGDDKLKNCDSTVGKEEDDGGIIDDNPEEKGVFLSNKMMRYFQPSK